MYDMIYLCLRPERRDAAAPELLLILLIQPGLLAVGSLQLGLPVVHLQGEGGQEGRRLGGQEVRGWGMGEIRR